MAKKVRHLDPAIEALVSPSLESNECIQSWSEFRPGEVMVRLIDQDLQQSLKERRLGRGGRGRTLIFRQEGGQWVFLGVGGWIS